MAKNTYGTGAFLLLNTGDTPHRSENGLLTTLAWDSDKAAASRSRTRSKARSSWRARRSSGCVTSSASSPTRAESEPLAMSVPDSAGVYVVPAFAGLGAPHWDAHARGAIVGLTRGASKAHITRATLEAIAYQVRDVVDAMERDSGVRSSELRVDGGAAANNFLLQTQADILGRDVVRPECLETTALGAAYLAGTGERLLERPRRPHPQLARGTSLLPANVCREARRAVRRLAARSRTREGAPAPAMPAMPPIDLPAAA